MTKPGQTISAPVSGVDVLPTLCESGLAQVPGEIDGASFLAALRGAEMERAKPLFWHYYQAIGAPKVALRSGPWKLLAHLDRVGARPGGSVRSGDVETIKAAKITQVELYNLAEDIDESEDLSQADPKRTSRLRAQLESMFDSVIKDAPDWEIRSSRRR